MDHPDELERLDLLLAPSVREPGPPPVERHLAAGRAALRRRRLTVATASLVALGAVGVGTAVLGHAAPGRTLQDPADRPGSPPSSTPPSPPPTPSRTADLTAGVADGPDVIGPTRRATGAEVAMMETFGDSWVALGETDDAVVVHPGWRVVDRVDDPAPVRALNRLVTPKTIVDATAVSVVPEAGTRGRPTYYYLDRASGPGSSLTSEAVGPLSGTLAWWTTQNVYDGSPMSNGTPGVDVRLLDDGRLAPEPGVEILDQQRDPDVGGYLRAEQAVTVVAQVRVPDGRVLHVVATRGPSYSGTTWFEPTDPPADLDEFVSRLREVYGEEPR